MDSKLQIISGQFRGRKLHLPSGARPTQNRARIAVFNMLVSVGVPDSLCVWDAFAGSGAWGIEFLSRYGNSRVVFSDVAPGSIKTVQKNLVGMGIDSRVRVVNVDATSVVEKYGRESNLVLLDAPYTDGFLADQIISKLTDVARPGTLVVWEQEVGSNHKKISDTWTVLRDKIYGRARFLILEKTDIAQTK